MSIWEKGRDETLGRISSILKQCQNFFDWEFCNLGCLLCLLCSAIHEVHNISDLRKKHNILFKIKEEEI